jgi:hypothetical protein
MLVLYSPQINEKDILKYKFEGEKIVVTYNGETDEFDFTNMPDGMAASYGREPSLVSTLPIQPVIEVKKENGILKVTLIKFINMNAIDEEKYPNWIEV